MSRTSVSVKVCQFEFSGIELCRFSYLQIIVFLNHDTNKHGNNGSCITSLPIGCMFLQQLAIGLFYILSYSSLLYRLCLESLVSHTKRSCRSEVFLSNSSGTDFCWPSQLQDVFSAAQNDLSIPEKHLPLQGVGFLTGVGKPEEPAVSMSPQRSLCRITNYINKPKK